MTSRSLPNSNKDINKTIIILKHTLHLPNMFIFLSHFHTRQWECPPSTPLSTLQKCFPNTIRNTKQKWMSFSSPTMYHQQYIGKWLLTWKIWRLWRWRLSTLQKLCK